MHHDNHQQTNYGQKEGLKHVENHVQSPRVSVSVAFNLDPALAETGAVLLGL